MSRCTRGAWRLISLRQRLSPNHWLQSRYADNAPQVPLISLSPWARAGQGKSDTTTVFSSSGATGVSWRVSRRGSIALSWPAGAVVVNPACGQTCLQRDGRRSTRLRADQRSSSVACWPHATVNSTLGPRSLRRGGHRPGTAVGPENKSDGNPIDSGHCAHRRLQHRGRQPGTRLRRGRARLGCPGATVTRVSLLPAGAVVAVSHRLVAQATRHVLHPL